MERVGEKDSLSNFPNSILLEIMSCLSTKEAVQASLLSKRWKDLWKNLSSLRLDSREFEIVTQFNEFLSVIFSRGTNSIKLHSLDFISPCDTVMPDILNEFIEFAVSQQVKELKMILNFFWNLSKSIESNEFPLSQFSCQNIVYHRFSPSLFTYQNVVYNEFPQSLFSCQNPLTILEIFVRGSSRPSVAKSLNLPFLVILRLSNISFCKGDNMNCAEPFSSCNKLKTLELRHCVVEGTQLLCISNATLANLTLDSHPFPFFQAKPYEIELSTPNLSSFVFKGVLDLPLIDCNLSSLEQVDIDKRNNGCYFPQLARASRLNCWLKVLANVRSLTLSSSIFQILDVHNIQPPCFGNLKTLKVEQQTSHREVNNLLRNTHSAEVTIIKYNSD